jgi:hypothetical protein
VLPRALGGTPSAVSVWAWAAFPGLTVQCFLRLSPPLSLRISGAFSSGGKITALLSDERKTTAAAGS